jgi:Family of unknown function (DUF6232)
MAEDVFFSDNVVRVSLADVQIGDRTYTLNDIRSVKVRAGSREFDPTRWYYQRQYQGRLLVVLLVGLALAGVLDWFVVGYLFDYFRHLLGNQAWDIIFFFIFLAMLIVVGRSLRKLQDPRRYTFVMVFYTGSGPVDVLTSQDSSYLKKIALAIRKARKAHRLTLVGA